MISRKSGPGADILVDMLKKSIKSIKVSNDDGTVPLSSDNWFQELHRSRTSGEQLRYYRDNAGLTLEALAEKSVIEKSHLSEMENNIRPIGLITAKKLAASLGCDFHRFLVA